MEIAKQNWLRKDGKPTLITGPCSAETEAQVLNAAEQLAKDDRVDYFRSGIWKPRTRPGTFEGIGEEGLKWMARVKEEFGLPLATEVATATHVKQALDHDIDLLWIGARTTVNPFATQEIADALKGSDKIVLVKNPINPDLSLWLGAIERLYACGVEKLGAIHRGFSMYEESKFRNPPIWKIPIELKRKFPNLPVIADPSHILGSREELHIVAQNALNLGFEGLMIESHPTPNEAWSDAAQQVTPARLVEILDYLELRTPKCPSNQSEYKEGIAKFREEIDKLDLDLISLLSKRTDIIKEIGELKKKFNIAVLQTGRWSAMLDDLTIKANEKDLNPKFVENIFKEIHQESVKNQNKIVNEK